MHRSFASSFPQRILLPEQRASRISCVLTACIRTLFPRTLLPAVADISSSLFGTEIGATFQVTDVLGFHALTGALSVGERQRVEILKVLYRSANILILDEPTAVLTSQEVDDLFATLQQMKKKGFL